VCVYAWRVCVCVACVYVCRCVCVYALTRGFVPRNSALKSAAPHAPSATACSPCIWNYVVRRVEIGQAPNQDTCSALALALALAPTLTHPHHLFLVLYAPTGSLSFSLAMTVMVWCG
jgi:hypothetical protein